MNKRTIVTAITSVIVFILCVINTVFKTDFNLSAEVIESIAVIIATGIMWFISNYFNQDYTRVANRITPLMRKIKEMEKQGDLSLLDAIEHLIDEWGDENDD